MKLQTLVTYSIQVIHSPSACASAPGQMRHHRLARWLANDWVQGGLLLVGLLLGCVALIIYGNVDRALTAEDRYYIQQYLPEVPAGIAPSLTYPQQLALIERARWAVYARTTGWRGIAQGQPREPKQLYLGRSGLCYDRSRVLEKIFTYLGFPNRHAALFAREAHTAGWLTVLFHHVSSHAVSEVETKKGWLMVDSNTLWVSLNTTNQPVSIPQFQKQGRAGSWLMTLIQPDRQVYSRPFIVVYGLYSRHGLFYAPFLAGIPDYQLQDLHYNLDYLLADLLASLPTGFLIRLPSSTSGKMSLRSSKQTSALIRVMSVPQHPASIRSR